ncbi:ABC-type dipeptide/oligopeptide/nickel transport system, permease component [Desulfitobacterium dichloroeliminans LMG P-21439]|uniref:ABC-type dipeptide/oligopeptide/nickel transport system, permease component n=1 Tax=Desulfitobacterium dichloroeliminans (strain LMG P-21439 / DCA1) TaxID=871963 RepID=L0F4S6_DESDL|nr:nickel transporter permease [Desulfitobacterium dichloroeliminans]AGA68015.1 ABC-type dipeptide/oligopeptide/nickel transport system, permease component [Desulfitobacterium dichloroeliminans LMG P-21439]
MKKDTSSGSDVHLMQAAEYVEKPESQLKEMWYTLKQNKAAVVGLCIIIILVLIALVVWASELLGIQVLPYDPNYSDMSKSFTPPNSEHWFGTDQLGRDMFSRVLDGTKISLSVGVAAVSISLTIGVILGAIAGYRGGRTDTIIMRFMDMILAIPSILLAIAFMAALGKGIDKAVIAIGLVSIPEYARIVRGSILSIKESDYVQAAKVIGNKDSRIIFKHILPNIISLIVVRATLGISTAVLDTAALGFLGLGVQPPFAEWGDMLGRARGFIFTAPYTLIFPGVAITTTVLAFNLLGDGLRDALDPKSRIK